MLYLVSYDIPSDKTGQRRRNRLAKYLESLGLRVQYSVFELTIDPARIDLIVREITDLIDAEHDSVRIYTCCASCAARVVRVGKEAVCEHQDLLVW
jgi:CRISPR-associated protein Cas2